MTNSTITLQGNARRIDNRGISEALCEKTKTYTDGAKLRFYYYDKSGRVTGCKVKTKDKDFWFEGEHDGSFWGQHLASGKGRRVVITEGELDALSCMEAMPGWDMVSLPNGAKAAKKSIKANLEFLQGYDEICLWFDDDEAGHAATEEAAQILPPGKVTIARLAPYKDASEALQAGATKAIYKAIFFDAKPYRPDGIVDGRALLELVTTPEPPNDYEYPYPGLNKNYCMALDEESLLRLLQAVAQASPHSAVSLQLHYYKVEGKEQPSGIWLLKNQIKEPLWV